MAHHHMRRSAISAGLENKILNIDHQLQRTANMKLVIESTKTNAGSCIWISMQAYVLL